jgi:phage tail-like protein
VSAPGADSRTKLFTNQFDVDLCEDITRVSSITARFPKVDCTDSADAKYKTFMPGNPVYGNITFEGNVHSNTFSNIKDWVKATYNGEDVRKTISVNIRKHQTEDAARSFTLHDCYPLSFNYVDTGAGGSGGMVRTWTLEVRVNRTEMA